MKLPRASLPVAAASAVSLGAQVLFSLLMLRLFTPQAVGEFSVVSQIAFFWMTLALAQSPLKLLADVHLPPVQALRAALRASLLRLVYLLPLIWLWVLVSGMPQTGQVLTWALLLTVLQLGWYLAQPFTLRLGSVRATALARALPPVIALGVAAALASLLPQPGSVSLMLAAAAGYAVGAAWLMPARKATAAVNVNLSAQPASSPQADTRSATLRLLHTAADAITGTAIILIWQRSHGAAEAGYLAVLLRILGFVPTLIHAAWAQVLLAQGERRQASSLWVGLGGVVLTGLFGLACLLAVQLQWLNASWAGLVLILLPIALWQAGACLLAACSHVPFQQGRASQFSYAAIGFDAMQLLVLAAPLALGLSLNAVAQAWWLGGASTLGLLALTWFVVRQPS